MEHVPCRPAPYGGPKIERLIDNLSRCTRVHSHSDARPAEALSCTVETRDALKRRLRVFCVRVASRCTVEARTKNGT